MKYNGLPSQAYLLSCLDYAPLTGFLRWRSRPISHFSSERSWRSWNTRHAGNAVGRLNASGHLVFTLDETMTLCHRVIWKMMTGEEPSALIDHRDTKPANNVWDNLREATRAQNRCNSKTNKTSTHGLKGVVRNGSGFGARIRTGEKYLWLGTFHSPEDAHAAYCKVAQEIRGEFWNPGSGPAR